MRMSSPRLDTPAVFLFEPMTGRPVSLNNSASRLLDFLSLAHAPRITLAAVERGLTAEARIDALSSSMLNRADGSWSELRRECRRQDGCVYALTRVWAPGSNTILTVEDMTGRVVEARGKRLAQILLRRIAAARDFAGAAHDALRVIQLFSGWAYGEVWTAGDGEPVRCAARGEPRLPADRGPGQPFLPRGPGREALPNGESLVCPHPAVPGCFEAALPLQIGGRLAGFMRFSSPIRASDGFALEVVAAAAPLAALALTGKRDQDALRVVKQTFSKTYVVTNVPEDVRHGGPVPE